MTTSTSTMSPDKGIMIGDPETKKGSLSEREGDPALARAAVFLVAAVPQDPPDLDTAPGPAATTVTSLTETSLQKEISTNPVPSKIIRPRPRGSLNIRNLTESPLPKAITKTSLLMLKILKIVVTNVSALPISKGNAPGTFRNQKLTVNFALKNLGQNFGIQSNIADFQNPNIGHLVGALGKKDLQGARKIIL